MNRANIVKLLRVLEVENIETEGEDWVRASCPFAPWLHNKGTDSRPSFGVSIGKQSHYNCFSCQRHGPLPMLVSNLFLLTGKDNEKARSIIANHEDLSIEDYESDEKQRAPLSILPEVLLKRFSPISDQMEYVRKRGVGKDAIRHWQLRFDTTSRRLIFPVRNAMGDLVAFRGRTVCDDTLKYREYTELSPNRSTPKAHGIWYGMQHMPPKTSSMILLVEGEMDVVLLWQALRRPGIWGAMGAQVSSEQIATLQALRNPVVLFFDNDDAGKMAKAKVLKKIIKVITGIFEVRDYCGCKDPGELVEKGLIKQALRSIDKCA